VRGDFDGDGHADLAVAVPGEEVNGVPSAGAVNVIYGSGSGLGAGNNQQWTLDSPGVVGASSVTGGLGSALAVGDFNGDGFSDLAIGDAQEKVDGVQGAGAVHVLYGSPSGLTATDNDLWSQDVPRVKDVAETSDRFGAALAAGDFDGDGFDDLAVGVLGESLGARNGAGAVNVIQGSAAGLTANGNQLFTENTPGVPGTSQEGDGFGSSLAAGDLGKGSHADLAVGAPGKHLGSTLAAGAAFVVFGSTKGLTGTGGQEWTQNSPGIMGTAHESDLFGTSFTVADFGHDGHADLAIGNRQDTIGGSTAGSVNVIYGSPTGPKAAGNQLLTEGSVGFTSTTINFGSSLAAANFGHDPHADLAIGSPSEHVPSSPDGGIVFVAYGGPNGLTTATGQVWDLAVAGMRGTHGNTGFGFALAAGNFGRSGQADLAVGSPFETVSGHSNAGAAHVLYGASNGLVVTGNQVWSQAGAIVGDPAATELFGDALG
jgi:hypothetical protein